MFKSVADRVKRIFERPANKAVDTVATLFAGQEQLSNDDKQVIALIKTLLPLEPLAKEKALSRFRNSLEKQYVSEEKIAKLFVFLRQTAPGSADDVLPVLAKQDVVQQKQLLSDLLCLAMSAKDFRPEALQVIADLAEKLKFSKEEFAEMADLVKNTHNSREMLLRSGTGIVLALIVIVLFVLVATWLSSLLFGVVLAYMFLPLEQYFERKLAQKPGRLTLFFKKINFLAAIKNKITRKSKCDLSPDEIERRKQQAITTHATTLTVSCVVFCGLFLLVLISVLLISYAGSLRNEFSAMKNKVMTRQSAVQESSGVVVENPAGKVVVCGEEQKCPTEKAVSDNTADGQKTAVAENGSFFSAATTNLTAMLNQLKERFESLPLIQHILDKLTDYLADGRAEEQVTNLLVKRSGGIFKFVGHFVAAFATFLLNLLMTFFFFSLFLGKLASFINSRTDRSQRASSYLIRTVFNGKWLPMMSEENLREGDRIVGEVINKLRIWLRGYMTLIAIDFCVYTTVFMLLGVPYAPILGAIAGIGILLPYIGPVSSALLTVLVTLAVGDATVLQIAGIIGIYLIHNGVIEQFFIYPWIIGESLGLTTLETIIVVLLGGILAGVPGMIFALPVSSVIKYLVPQIYRCWK